MKKIIHYTSIICLVIAFICFGSYILTGSIFGYKPFIVVSESMEPVLDVGDFIIGKVVDEDNLSVGDIAAYDVDGNYVVHRIVEKKEAGYIFKGDNNVFADQDIVSPDKIKYRIVAY